MTAEELHEIFCDDIRPCGTWVLGSTHGQRHRDYYRDKAAEINERLEPEIGTANVKLAVQTVWEVLL